MNIQKAIPFRSLIILFAALVFTGCASKAQRRLTMLSESAESGDFREVISVIQKNKKSYGRQGELLYYADIGVLFHYLGEYDSSTAYLEKAVAIHDDLFSKSVTNEAASLVTNDNVRPYRSKPFELIFIHQIMAFNYLAKNDTESALVESRRTQLLMDEWNRKDRQGEKTSDDGLFQYISAINYNDMGEPGNASVSLYKSLEAYDKAGIPAPGQVTAMAYDLFSNQERWDDIEKFSLKETTDSIQNGESEIIVVGYGGRGPTLGESVWWGSYIKDGAMILHHHDADGNEMTQTIFVPSIEGATGETFSVKFAMPMNKTYNSQVHSFSVTTKDSAVFSSEVVNNMDLLNEQYLEDHYAKNLVRTVVRVVTRTIAAEKAKNAMATDSPVANFLINITTDIAAGQLEKADTRSLFLLPKRIHMTRIPVDAGTQNIVVTSIGKNGQKLKAKEYTVGLNPGEKKYLFVPELY